MLIFLEVLVGTILLVWIVLTIIAQCSEKAIVRLLPAYLVPLIPTYTFFAPVPGMQDFSLFIRYKTVENEYSNWNEVNPNNKRRNLLSIVWNPQKKINKVFFDLTVLFIKFNMDFKKEESPNYNFFLMTSVPYLMILNYISNLPQIPIYSEIQFSITSRISYLESAVFEPLFISEFHALDGPTV